MKLILTKLKLRNWVLPALLVSVCSLQTIRKTDQSKPSNCDQTCSLTSVLGYIIRIDHSIRVMSHHDKFVGHHTEEGSFSPLKFIYTAHHHSELKTKHKSIQNKRVQKSLWKKKIQGGHAIHFWIIFRLLSLYYILLYYIVWKTSQICLSVCWKENMKNWWIWTGLFTLLVNCRLNWPSRYVHSRICDQSFLTLKWMNGCACWSVSL